MLAENPYETKFEYEDDENRISKPSAHQYQVSAWKNIAKMRNKPLSDGTDREGKTYSRKLNYQPGYFDMAHIVAGLGKTIKPLAAGRTLAEAEAYVNAKDRRGRPIRPNWEAFEMDITGPNGKPDGLNEILITDSKGNLKAVNGYTLKKNDYGWKRAYQTAVPPEQRRDGEHAYTDFKKTFREKAWNAKDRIPYWTNNIVEVTNDESLKNLQGEIKPKEIFKAVIFDPVYETFKEEIKGNTACLPLRKAQLANKAMTLAWRAIVVNPVLKNDWTTYINGTESREDMKELNKVTRTKEYKEAIQARTGDMLVPDYLGNVHELVARIIRNVVDYVWEEHDPNDLADSVYLPFNEGELYSLDNDKPIDESTPVIKEATAAKEVVVKEVKKGGGLKFGKMVLTKKEAPKKAEGEGSEPEV